MAVNLSSLTLICPDNDLESHAIIEIAKSKGIDTIIHPGGWGIELDPALVAQHNDSIKRHVAIVELPNISLEIELRKSGHDIHLIDHHDYPEVSRQHPSSSLEIYQVKPMVEWS